MVPWKGLQVTQSRSPQRTRHWLGHTMPTEPGCRSAAAASGQQRSNRRATAARFPPCSRPSAETTAARQWWSWRLSHDLPHGPPLAQLLCRQSQHVQVPLDVGLRCFCCADSTPQTRLLDPAAAHGRLCSDACSTPQLPDKHKQTETHPVLDTAFGHLLRFHELWHPQVRLPGEPQNSKFGSAKLPLGPKVPAPLVGRETPRARQRARRAPWSRNACRRCSMLQLRCPRPDRAEHLQDPQRRCLMHLLSSLLSHPPEGDGATAARARTADP